MRAAVSIFGGSGVKNSGIPKPEENKFSSTTASTAPKSTGKTFLQKLSDVVTYNQNMQNANGIMAMGALLGNEQMQSTGQQMMEETHNGYTAAVKEFQYVGERAAGGAAKGAEGVVNALGYLGQTVNRAQIQQNAQSLDAWGALTGNRNFTGAANSLYTYDQELKNNGLQDTAKFGTKYQQSIQDKYADANITKTGRALGDVSETVGGLAPSAVMNVIAPGSGIAVSALSAGGNATQEALANGASDHEALAYGTAVGVIEAATEKIFDGVAGIFGKGAADDFVESIAKRLAKSEGAQTAFVKIANSLGEGVEEFISEFGTRVVNELIVDTDDRSVLQTLGDAGYSALMGAIVGGVVQTADGMISSVRSDPKLLAQQAADAAIAQIKAQNSQNKTAPANAGAEYRAVKPENVELPTVPIINLSMQDVADLNGGAVPTKGNYLRKTVTDRAEQRLGLDKNETVYIEASNVKRNGEDYVLRISKGTLGKAFAGKSYDDGTVPVENALVMENLERIVNNGVWYESEPDRYARQQIAGYDYLKTVVYIDDVPYEVNMRVRVYDEKAGGGNRLYHFTPEEVNVTKIKEGTSPTGTLHERAIQKTGEVPSTVTTVPQAAPGVKNEYAPERGAQFGETRQPTLAQQIDSMRQQLMDMQHRQKVDTLMAEYEKNVGPVEVGTNLDEPVAVGYDTNRKILEEHSGYNLQNENGTSTKNDWEDKLPDLSKHAPIEIPSSATVRVQAKQGYDQIAFKWFEGGYTYEVRWHTKTPGAPEGQGNTWVVSRAEPGTPTGQMRKEFILVGDVWISRGQWQEAITAYRNEIATTEQLQLLKDGHWKAP